MVDKVVKVDEELLKKVEELIKKERFRFSSNKQVVNLALVEFLKSYNIKINIKRGKK